MATMDNLVKAFEGESWAIRKYVAFAEKAEQEGFKQAARLFRALTASEKGHVALCQKALNNLENEKDEEYYVYRHCGNVVETMPADSCPICNSTKSMYLKIS